MVSLPIEALITIIAISIGGGYLLGKDVSNAKK